MNLIGLFAVEPIGEGDCYPSAILSCGRLTSAGGKRDDGWYALFRFGLTFGAVEAGYFRYSMPTFNTFGPTIRLRVLGPEERVHGYGYTRSLIWQLESHAKREEEK